MAKHETDTKIQPNTEKRVRKPYHAPVLKQYGDLGRITGAKGGKKGDGAGVPRTKA
jgi:hypothetical protein